MTGLIRQMKMVCDGTVTSFCDRLGETCWLECFVFETTWGTRISKTCSSPLWFKDVPQQTHETFYSQN